MGFNMDVLLPIAAVKRQANADYADTLGLHSLLKQE